MGLYVSVSLLAALTALAEHEEQSHPAILAIVWGTTLGLALAHLFAFRVSAQLIAKGSVPVSDRKIAAAQLGGAVVVAALCTAPVLVFDSTAELDVARIMIAALVAAVGARVARRSGSSLPRALAYGLVVFVVAMAVAITKNVLSGH